MIKNINEHEFYANYEDMIYNQDKPAVLCFSAEWCNPCKLLAPLLNKIAEDTQDVLILKFNIDDSPNLIQDHHIMTVPSMILFKNGNIVEKITSVQPESVIRKSIEALRN